MIAFMQARDGRRRFLACGVLAALAGSAVPLPAFPAPADDAPWVLRYEDEAGLTRIWLRQRPGGAPAFRATTVIEARLSALAAVLLDAAHTQEWVYRARSAELLESDGPTRGVSLVVTRMPWPLADRESIVAWELTQDPATLVVTLAGQGAPQKRPPDPQRVRIMNLLSRWQLVPRAGSGSVDVLFEGQGDPGGNLALPLLAEFVADAAWQAPLATLAGLRAIVMRPPFAQAVLPFVREPGP
jgi:hypothetical protein